MSTQKMSIHRALSELKTYDARIKKAAEATFILSNKRSNDKIQGKTIEEHKNIIKGNYASYYALVENQKRIKAAIVLSNAATKVKIAGNEYTVAEAIERKVKIKHDIMFLHNLKSEFFESNKKVEKENALLPDKLEKYLQAVLGDKDKRTVEDIAAHTKVFEEKNTFELIDPCDISNHINTLEENIRSFQTEVDYTLSESNATTFVEVMFVS
jgi:hypothetical protein